MQMTIKKSYQRTPKYYSGTRVTSHHISALLPAVLSKVSELYSQRPDLVLASWPEIIGPKLALMTQALSFSEGVLVVKVKNSTLYSLLNQHDKPRILSSLRKKFPRVDIKTIVFRIG